MRRICSALLAAVILLAFVPSAGAGKKAKPPKKVMRTEVGNYEMGSYGIAGQVSTTDCSAKIGCVVFKSEPTERFVRVDISDLTGQPPLGQVEVDGEMLAFFCGTSERPIEIPAGSEVMVRVFGNIVPFYACGIVTGFPTQGEVSATFSNIP